VRTTGLIKIKEGKSQDDSERDVMLFMVVERFKNRNARQVYRRARQKGRMLPEGLYYINSWVATDFNRCFQLMETEDSTLFRQWTSHWEDLVEFEIIPVVSSEEAQKMISSSGYLTLRAEKPSGSE
jgi:hypothetical protein